MGITLFFLILHLTNPPTIIPAIAKIGPITVGWTTMEECERLMGKGAESLGGHAHGARTWRLRNTKRVVYADGFDLGPGGLVLNMLMIEKGNSAPEGPGVPEPYVPFSKKPQDWFKFAGKVTIGMDKARVLKLLKSAVPKPMINGDNLVWHQTGYAKRHTSDERPYTDWTTTLEFQKNKLIGIRLELD
jgi:hypothetical protein